LLTLALCYFVSFLLATGQKKKEMTIDLTPNHQGRRRREGEERR
jgi:hypothetical protein